MSNVAINVEGLGKRYRIGAAQKRSTKLSETLKQFTRSPFDYLLTSLRPPTEEETLWALQDVSFEVNHGEVIGIIGRNGAGKSTLLKILSRITEPTKGQVDVYGRVGSLLEVGTGFHPELTGRENIYLNGAILGMNRKEIDLKFDEITEFSEIGKFIDTPVKRYSSGMSVRLAFSVAAHLEPEILIVDEVLAVGDVGFQHKSLGKMEDVSGHGRTVLFVTHNMAMASHLCQRGILLDDGHIKFDGAIDQAISIYLKGFENSQGEQTGAVNRQMLLQHQASADRIRVEEIRLRNQNQDSITTLRFGDTLFVDIYYYATEPIIMPAFRVSISDGAGTLVGLVNTMPMGGYVIDEIIGSGRISLEIPNLQLTGGSYYITIGVNRPRVEALVLLENVAHFEMLAEDVFQAGYPIHRKDGVLVLNHNWKHKPDMPKA